MKYEFNFGNGVICLPQAVTAKLDSAGELDLKLLLLLASSEELRENPNSAKIATILGHAAAEVDISLAFWRGAGILKGGKSTKKSDSTRPATPATTTKEPVQMALPAPEVISGTRDMPSYTGAEIEQLLQSKRSLGALLDECQNALGKVFGPHESGKIIALSDYLGLEDAYILLLCTYCKSIDKGSVAYVAKTATELYSNNVDNLAALEAYIENREKAASFEGKMRSLMGIGARALSTREKKFFSQWAQYGWNDEIYRLAYDQTVDSSGKAAVGLMNTILAGWYQKGVRCVADAENCIAEHKNEMKKQYAKKKEPAEAGTFAESSFDTDEFFDIALKKSMEIAREQQDGDKK